jgi:hypothetical protein
MCLTKMPFSNQGQNSTFICQPMTAHCQLTHVLNICHELLPLVSCWLDMYFRISLCHGYVMHFQVHSKSEISNHEALACYDDSNNFQMSFVRCCKNPHPKIPIISQVGQFCPWIFNYALEIWLFALTIFDEFQLCTMKVHVKWSLCIKRSLNLDTPCGSYAPLIMGHFWNWMDHNLPTIHGKFKFLDFLERWEQDLQLSCWTNFHLKLPWTRGFEVKNFPFLETSITSHFLFLAILVLTWFSPFLSFAMSNNTCFNMNEVHPTLSHLQIH